MSHLCTCRNFGFEALSLFALKSFCFILFIKNDGILMLWSWILISKLPRPPLFPSPCFTSQIYFERHFPLTAHSNQNLTSSKPEMIYIETSRMNNNICLFFMTNQYFIVCTFKCTNKSIVIERLFLGFFVETPPARK